MLADENRTEYSFDAKSGSCILNCLLEMVVRQMGVIIVSDRKPWEEEEREEK
jgi:hypothetical protein